MSGYEAVMQLATHDDADFWLPHARGFHTLVMYQARKKGIPAEEVELSFGPLSRLGKLRRLLRYRKTGLRELRPLFDAGVLTTAGDQPGAWPHLSCRMRDPEGVGRALDELHVSQPT